MHDDFHALYAFNRWADKRVLDACRLLTPEQYVAAPAPGWSSVRATVYHIAIVTNGWIRGVAGETVGMPPSEAEVPTVDDAERLLVQAQQIIEKLLPTLTPDWLATPREFRGAGRSAVLPPWAVLRHVVNHATYHRGQIASKLKRLGIEQPPTDFIFWVFEQMAKKG